MTRKHDDIPTIPLFDVPPPTAQEKVSAPRSVGFARCPCCNTEKLVGLVRQGTHLYWRSHSVPMFGGRTRICPGSDAPLHSVPIPNRRRDQPECPCIAIGALGK